MQRERRGHCRLEDFILLLLSVLDFYRHAFCCRLFVGILNSFSHVCSPLQVPGTSSSFCATHVKQTNSQVRFGECLIPKTRIYFIYSIVTGRYTGYRRFQGEHTQKIEQTMKIYRYHQYAFACLLLAVGCQSQENDPPNYWACQNDIARSFPYCDATLSIDDRLEDLISRLTLEEKVSLISPQPELGSTCATHTASVPRLGLPSYMWLVEVNSAVASKCFLGKCATQFAGPLSMAASFNKTSWYWKGRVIGTEQRAFANLHNQRSIHDDNAWIGLTGFGPNLNQPRDPRYGRTSELPGEDPILSGMYGVEMVRGMQHRDASGYPLMLAYLKHFAAYNKERGRGHDTHNISTFDLFDTYLRQFEIAMPNATGVMCSYNGINGVPSCANGWLLNDILRKRWKRPDAHVTSDCGAIVYLMGYPAYAKDNETAASWGINNGTDVEMGTLVYTEYLKEAVLRGLVAEETVDRSIRRGYRPLFVAGRFDDPAASEWTRLGFVHVRSPLHEQIRLEAALQGLVLLKNDNNILPLVANHGKVAVLGPLSQTRNGLMSDYENDESCPWEGYKGHGCIPTLAESIQELHPSAVSASGVDVDSNRTDGMQAALELAIEADVVVLCLGTTKAQEREGLDRTTTALPGLQNDFAMQVFATGTPVVLVFVHGGQIAIDSLVEPAAAIVEAFNPNDIGGKALALTLFGKENRWGKLPYTVYPFETMESFDMFDYSMSKAPGRTYRYFSGKPIFSFGFGLSYTSFSLTKSTIESPTEETIVIECLVQNTGPIAGEEVVQIYHIAGNDIRETLLPVHPVPLKQLVAFDRIRVESNSTGTVRFTFDKGDVLSLTNEGGRRVVYSGTHVLSVTNGVQDPIEHKIVIHNGPAFVAA